ncbi:hypothetical protein FE257_010529 [Aspergillus nanangensis]|uniref:IEC3 subunit of the Ino80 complex, chromatin re-modelling-domain-containing protein n=1 Tax=Aspergillus nanangensis TaxID=2582783 RepID=A0AAD4CIF9_ASPNN|nr:hypothetical protein FE257_010529 [Aspergillus nanangensis]
MSQDGEDTRSVAESLPDAPAHAPTKKSYRSFKKKFAKLKIQFELRMKESESLIREELRIQDLSKRIQEQNDQLLEVLMEFNDSIHVPSDIRYDLSAAGDESFLPTTDGAASPSSEDLTATSQKLKDARSEMQNGNISVETYRRLENTARRAKAFAPHMQYISLLKVPHTAPALEGQNTSSTPTTEEILGFFTPEHETEYCLAMDAKLGDDSAALQLNRAPEKPTFVEREREAALRNPVSVYNWLRRNQPHIFLQDNENASEKSTSRPSNLRTSKKPPTQLRKDEDTHDEEGSLGDTGPIKGKRKREEDAGYKPKSSSSRSNRRKKDDGSTPAKRTSKRSSGVGA